MEWTSRYLCDLDYSVTGNAFKFEDIGALNSVKQAVFIVVVALLLPAELVVNSLKPYTVKLVNKTTYGKPT